MQFGHQVVMTAKAFSENLTLTGYHVRVSEFFFKTKAENLEQLNLRHPEIKIPSLFHFTRLRWQQESGNVLREILKQFSGPIIVRSSALGEDAYGVSLAGAFESSVCPSVTSSEVLAATIGSVFRSMTTIRSGQDQDRVLIQEYLSDVQMSGVIFSRDLATGAPYLVINYDDLSGRTDRITSGSDHNSGHTLWVHRRALDRVRSPRFHKIINLFSWLEDIAGNQLLDVEFALLHDDTFVLLQIRPLADQSRPEFRREVPSLHELDRLGEFVQDAMGPRPDLRGVTTVFGQMPDWNPAEIIGRAPKPLARDLYENLVTDQVWAEARTRMGYRNLVGYPLALSFGGQPFIDVRVSFNSFLPASIDDNLGERLVNSWLDRLATNPQLHDKVEFEVATPNYRFDLHDFYSRHYKDRFQTSEIDVYSAHLRRLMIEHVTDSDGSRESAGRSLADLAQRQLMNEALPNDEFLLGRELALCRNLGTIPFAIFARHAFAARTIILSLESASRLPTGFTSTLHSAVRTVATDFTERIAQTSTPEEFEEVLSAYGHLRPGTYEIGSPRYDEIPRSLFLEQIRSSESTPENRTKILENSVAELAKVLDLVQESEVTADELVGYFVETTQQREWAKLIFTRTVSRVLQQVESRARKRGISREEASYLSLETLLSVERDSGIASPNSLFKTTVEANQRRFDVTKSLRLPVLLCSPEDIWVIPIEVSHPNFITSEHVIAPIVNLTGASADWQAALDGSIVAIESADPGFDWIFSRRIAGLITRFGGANSHMAIRCSEFQLPAAIGCGAELFGRVLSSSVVELDCAQQSVRPLK